MSSKNSNTIYVLVVLLTLGVGAIGLRTIQLAVTPLGIIPGFEGLDAGVEGVYLRGQFYRLGDPLPVFTDQYQYAWGDTTPRSTVLHAQEIQYVKGWGGVRIEVGRPREINDPFSSPKKVDYWVRDGEEYHHIKGEIVAYSLPVTLSIRRMGGVNQYVFKGEKVWIGLAAVAWDQAVQEQSPYTGTAGYGTAWQAPLAAVLTSYSVQDQGDNYQLEPSEIGRDIVLYDTPIQSGVISDLGYKASINSTFSGDPSPDSRLSSTAFFSITMSEFGMTSGLFSSSAPVASYEIKIYSLQIGKYTYTNPDDTPWAVRAPEDNWWERTLGASLKARLPLLILGVTLIVFYILFQGSGVELLKGFVGRR